MGFDWKTGSGWWVDGVGDAVEVEDEDEEEDGGGESDEEEVGQCRTFAGFADATDVRCGERHGIGSDGNDDSVPVFF